VVVQPPRESASVTEYNRQRGGKRVPGHQNPERGETIMFDC
jgi:hypothetical protein